MVLNGKQSQTLHSVRRIVAAFDGKVEESTLVLDGEPSFEVRDDEGQRLFLMSLDGGGRALAHDL